jgi:hypothetical protein
VKLLLQRASDFRETKLRLDCSGVNHDRHDLSRPARKIIFIDNSCFLAQKEPRERERHLGDNYRAGMTACQADEETRLDRVDFGGI